MRVEQSFGPSPTGGVWYQYTAHIDGEMLSARTTIGERGYGQHPPIEYVLRDLKSQLMREIERRLFKGVS